MKNPSISASTSVMFHLMEMHGLHSELRGGGKSEFCWLIVQKEQRNNRMFLKGNSKQMCTFLFQG